jgi:hypothetical protein
MDGNRIVGDGAVAVATKTTREKEKRERSYSQSGLLFRARLATGLGHTIKRSCRPFGTFLSAIYRRCH